MLANRVKETTATTGTGSFTTAGAVSGFQTFNTAFGTDVRFTYWAVNDTDSEWETGVGYLSASTTLVRETVQDNSAGTTSAISFTTAPSLFSSANTNVGLFAGYQSENSSGLSAGISSGSHASSNSTLGCANNRLHCQPFLLTASKRITGAKVNITATGTATTGRLGLYEVDDTGDAGKLLAETGDIAVNTTGIKSASFGSAVNVPSGWYWMAFVNNGTVTVRNSRADIRLGGPEGLVASTWTTYNGVYRDIGAWSAMPNPGGALTFTAAITAPCLMLE